MDVVGNRKTVSIICLCIIAVTIVLKDGITGFTIAFNIAAIIAGIVGYTYGSAKNDKTLWRK